MPIVVARVDDRLVHGQVVIGWCRPLKINRILLVDDAVAASEFEQELYRMAVPEGIGLDVVSTGEAPEHLDRLAALADRTLVITATVAAMIALQQARPRLLQNLNLGGIHDGTDRRERLRYIYLTAAEAEALAAVERTGVSISAQDLPTTRPVPLEDLL